VVVPGDGFQIASRGVNVPVVLMAVEASGNMPGNDPTVAIIYTWEAFPQFGGTPGRGNTVIYGRRATPAGPAIFIGLTTWQPGDQIKVTLGGQVYDYTVVNKCRVPITSSEEVVRPKSAESLTIMTDNDQPANTHRLVVVAERQPNSVPRECATGGTPL
jgi:LPXTG-site transpeptidase (sortase) family protein